MKRKLLIACFIIFNMFAIIKASNIEIDVIKNDGSHIFGDCDRTVINVYNKAKAKSIQPYLEVKDHFLYEQKNPGLFIFITELFLRAGIDNLFIIRLFFLLCFNIGVVFLIKWIDKLFYNDIITVSSIMFITVTPLFLHYSSIMHQWPMDMLFFNLTIYYYLLFKEKNDIKYFSVAIISYFFLCQSYYMFYISTFIIVTGINYIKGSKIIDKYTVMMAIVPIVSIILLAIQIIHYHGNIKIMLDYLFARTLDVRLEGSEWQNHDKILNIRTIIYYPIQIIKRIDMFYHFNGILMIFMLVFVYVTEVDTTRKKLLIILLAASLSWNIVMIQHTRIHDFSVTYGYYIWMLIFGCFVNGLKSVIDSYQSSISVRKKYYLIFSFLGVVYFVNSVMVRDLYNVFKYMN